MAYRFYSSVTVDNTKVSGTSDLTNFPILVTGTYDGTGGEPDLRTTGNGGNIQNTATGGAASITVPADFVFSPNTDGSSPYDFEIESYNASTGAITAWVEIPTLSYNSDTTLYMVYGDSGVSTSQENVNGTWGAYQGVWHLGESGNGTANEFKDSTSNANHGTGGAGTASAVPTQAAVQIANGQSFDGGDFINAGDMTTFDGASALYISAWVKQDSLGNTNRIVAKWTGGGGQSFHLLTGPSATSEEDEIEMGVFTDGSNFHDTKSSGFNLSAATTYHIAGVWRGGTDIDIYKNGTEATSYNVAATSGTPSTLANSTEELTFGARWNGGSQDLHLTGDIDEIRISTTAHSSDWVVTDYNTQGDSANFYSVGSEVDSQAGGGAPDGENNLNLNNMTL